MKNTFQFSQSAVLISMSIALMILFFSVFIIAPAQAEDAATPTQPAAATQPTQTATGDCGTGDGFDPCGTLGQIGLPSDSPKNLAYQIIKTALSMVGIIALVLIIYGGFLWMTSAGNEQKIKKGKDILLWAIIGALLILSSLGIVEFIDRFI